MMQAGSRDNAGYMFGLLLVTMRHFLLQKHQVELVLEAAKALLQRCIESLLISRVEACIDTRS